MRVVLVPSSASQVEPVVNYRFDAIVSSELASTSCAVLAVPGTLRPSYHLAVFPQMSANQASAASALLLGESMPRSGAIAVALIVDEGSRETSEEDVRRGERVETRARAGMGVARVAGLRPVHRSGRGQCRRSAPRRELLVASVTRRVERIADVARKHYA